MLPTPLPVRPVSSYRLVFFALIVGLLLGASAVGLSWFLTGRPGVVQPTALPAALPAALCVPATNPAQLHAASGRDQPVVFRSGPDGEVWLTDSSTATFADDQLDPPANSVQSGAASTAQNCAGCTTPH